MGDPRRFRKKFETPRKPWDLARIESESHLLDEFGLKSMRELWVMEAALRKIRREARHLLSQSAVPKGEELIARARKMGIAKQNATLDDLLSLDIRDILARRLQTLVVRKGLAKTVAQARQLIAHGNISVRGRRTTSPSYIVPVAEEQGISYYGKAPVAEQKAAAAAPKEVVTDG